MDVFRGEQFDDLTQDILQELHGLLVTGTDHIVRDTPFTTYFIRTTRTSQFRIGGQSGLLMTRHIDFRNDRDVTLGCIIDDLFHLLLRIETTILLSVILATVMANDGFATFRTNFRQLRILLDLDTPTLVFTQMPMETVHVVQGNHVDVLLDRIRCDVVATDIQHHTTIGETRCILNGNSRQLDTRSLCVSRNGFTKRLDTIENTGWCSTGNLYPLRIHLQAITFGIGDRSINRQHNTCTFTGYRLQTIARQFLDIIGQE